MQLGKMKSGGGGVGVPWLLIYETVQKVHKSKEAIKGNVIYTITNVNSHLQRWIVQNEILLSEKCPTWKLHETEE